MRLFVRYFYDAINELNEKIFLSFTKNSLIAINTAAIGNDAMQSAQVYKFKKRVAINTQDSEFEFSWDDRFNSRGIDRGLNKQYKFCYCTREENSIVV